MENTSQMWVETHPDHIRPRSASARHSLVLVGERFLRIGSGALADSRHIEHRAGGTIGSRRSDLCSTLELSRGSVGVTGELSRVPVAREAARSRGSAACGAGAGPVIPQ